MHRESPGGREINISHQLSGKENPRKEMPDYVEMNLCFVTRADVGVKMAF